MLFCRICMFLRKKLVRISKLFVVCAVFVCAFSFSSFADLVEIKNGVKTTYLDKDQPLIDTVDKYYDFKWALNGKGNWKLYLRGINGRLMNLSNHWVNFKRLVPSEDGEVIKVIDYYYFDYYGNMVTGWLVDKEGNKMYLNTGDGELGRMARGWLKIDDDYYFFSEQGILQKNIITEDGFYVDEEGKWK